jgi:hypothetical protein
MVRRIAKTIKFSPNDQKLRFLSLFPAEQLTRNASPASPPLWQAARKPQKIAQNMQ